MKNKIILLHIIGIGVIITGCILCLYEPIYPIIQPHPEDHWIGYAQIQCFGCVINNSCESPIRLNNNPENYSVSEELDVQIGFFNYFTEEPINIDCFIPFNGTYQTINITYGIIFRVLNSNRTYYLGKYESVFLVSTNKDQSTPALNVIFLFEKPN